MHRYVYILINCFFTNIFIIISYFIFMLLFMLLRVDIMIALMPYPTDYISVICNNVNHSHIN
jgi:hypothetical protein